VDYLDNDLDIEDFLEETQQNQKHRLEDELEKIREQLDQRDQLHKEILEELESKLDWYLERLENEYSRVGSPDVDQLKAEVKRFYTQIRNEKQQHWRDKQELEKERRQILQEIDELSLDESLFESL
jgi:DNA repair exonuclease SbcCD ATPase subunit